MAYRNLYLVRHGQYVSKQREAGALTPLGEDQAHAAAQALKHVPFSRIYFSTMLRAEQTARIIATHHHAINFQPTDLLRECIPTIPPVFENAFRSVAPDLTYDKVTLCADQLDSAFDQLICPPADEEDDHELLVCHGNVIRYLVARTLHFDPHIWVKMMINHCGITRLMVDSDGEVYLVSHNETGHLPFDLRTEN